MESYARIFILCLLCVAHASKVLPKDINEFKDGSLARFQEPSGNPMQEVIGTDGRITDKSRDKRALGLLLSGLAQIFGYTVTPIQIASLPNPNATKPAAMTANLMTGQQTAGSRPANTTAPKQQETIRFTGVLNFGNSTDILGHLQRYEQIFHSRGSNMTNTTMPTTPPPPKPSANLSLDPRTTISTTRPPLLAPFFVKIPLPIAPNLVPVPMPINDFKLTYPVAPLISAVSDTSENAVPPVRKEQEIIYRNNEDTERYTVVEKDIYDAKGVRKPMSKYRHQLYVDEPSWNKQQNARYNQVQHKQEKHIARLKEQEEQRNRDKDGYDREDEINEKHKNREEEIANRNRGHVIKYVPTEERRPANNDEENQASVEEYEELSSQPNPSSESSKQPQAKDEREKAEDYPNYDDEPNKQLNGYKRPDRPANLNKYIEAGYNKQLPIGDYFHEGNPENIRDSYGEVLNNKKLEDDRLSSYFTMFKQPYTGVYDLRGIQNPDDASREDGREEISAAKGYHEHLIRIQKLREEYALPVPENKYEEYDITQEGEADGDDRESGRVQKESDTPAKSKRPQTGRLRDKEETRAKTTSGSSGNQSQRDESANSGDAKSQEEIDFVKYTPLVVPIRYVDATDRMEQATTRQLKYKDSNKSVNSQPPGDNVDVAPTVSQEKLTPQIGLPGRPRQLHEQSEESEYKNFQIWPPPFDYAFDNTERMTTVLPADPQSYPINHYQNIVTNAAANDANNENSSEQPSGYVIVVGDPAHPYRYPYNIYYLPNEALNSQNQGYLNPEDTHPQHQLYLPQQNVKQQSVQTRPNLTEYNHNETTNSPHNYHYQSQEAPTDVLDRYRYILGGRAPHASKPSSTEARNQIYNIENWSNRIYQQQPQDNVVRQSPPDLARLQDVASANRNVRNESSKKQAYSSRRRRNMRREVRRKNDRKVETPSHRSIETSKPFDDPQSAHDFFGFSKNDYSFHGESDDASKAAEENGKITKESQVLVAPEPVAYHHDESLVKHTDEPENDMEKAKVTEYRNKVAILKVSEQRRLTPNGPIHYVDYIRNI